LRQAVEQYKQLQEQQRTLNQQLRMMRATAGESGLRVVTAQARNTADSLRDVRERLRELGAFKSVADEWATSAINATRGLSGLLSVFGGFASVVPGLQDAIRPIQQLGFALALARTAGMGLLSVLGLFAGAQLVGWIVRAGMEFAQVEERLVRIRLAAGQAELPLSNLLTKAAALAQRAVAPLSETVRAVEELVKAGVPLEQAFGRAGEALLMFARRAEVGAAEAVRMLTSVSEQMGVTMTEAAKAIVAAAELSSASTEEIARSFTEVGFAARQMGLDITQTGAILSLLAAGGLRGAAAGTAFRWLITQAQQIQSGTATGAAESTLMALGLGGVALQFQMGKIGLVEFLKALKETGATMGELQKLFGRYGTRAAAILMENIDALEEHTRAIRKNSESLIKGNEQLVNTLSAQRQKAVEEFKIWLAELGQGFKNFFLGVVAFLNEARKFLGIKTSLEATNQVVEMFLQEAREGGLLPSVRVLAELQTLKPELQEEVFRRVIEELGVQHPMIQGFHRFITQPLPTDDPLLRAYISEDMARMFERIFQERMSIVQEIERLGLGRTSRPPLTVGTLAERIMREEAQRRYEIEQALRKAWQGLMDFEAALYSFVVALQAAASQLRAAPRGLGETVSALVQSGLQGFARWAGTAASSLVTPLLQSMGLTGTIGAGEGAISIAQVMGSVAGALVAGAVVSVGQGIVNAIVSIGEGLLRALTPPGRGMTLRGEQIRYDPRAYASLQGRTVRTGQGLATVPVLLAGGGSTFAPTLHIGAINVQGSADHHKLANRIADTITRYVSQTLESYYWKAVTRREGLAEVF
jgi:TP901 family phage tail tape measure protein